MRQKGSAVNTSIKETTATTSETPTIVHTTTTTVATTSTKIAPTTPTTKATEAPATPATKETAAPTSDPLIGNTGVISISWLINSGRPYFCYNYADASGSMYTDEISVLMWDDSTAKVAAMTLKTLIREAKEIDNE